MDTHNVGRARNGLQQALQQIKAKTLVIGIDSDILFPPAEQQYLQQQISNAKIAIINSLYGHDGFLLEHKKISALIKTAWQQ